jgi:hypothetical protein
MVPALLIAMFGAGFVLLGRWLYSNPTKVFQAWGILNRENPDVQKLGRAKATFLIFFGMFTCVVTIIPLLFPGPFVVVLVLATSLAGTGLLRPRLPQIATSPIEPTLGDTTDTAEKQSLFSKNWKRNLAISMGIMVLLLGVMFSVVFALLADSDASKIAFAAAQTSPTVTQRLGEPVKRGFFTTGAIHLSGPAGHADLDIPISGPKGKATVYAVAEKSAGFWKLETLQVSFSEGGGREDLLKQEVESGQH